MNLQDQVVDWGNKERDSERYIFDNHTVLNSKGKKLRPVDCVFFEYLSFKKECAPLLKPIRCVNYYSFHISLYWILFQPGEGRTRSDGRYPQGVYSLQCVPLPPFFEWGYCALPWHEAQESDWRPGTSGINEGVYSLYLISTFFFS